jgi:deazaflavin-dependent oxidoreductase (nitroreductase family)
VRAGIDAGPAAGQNRGMGLLSLHARIYEATGGRVGHRLIGVPCVLLHTIGRKSGQPRVSVLVYAMDGDDFVLVASNSGSDKAPGWYYNVKADPKVSVQLKTRRMPATAAVVEADDPQYARLWQLVNTNNHNRYNGYQQKTSRKIPLVVVAPDE